MAVALTGAGSLFVRLGHLYKIADVILTHVGTTIPAEVDTLFADYTTSDQDQVSGLYPALTSYKTTPGTFLSYLQSLAQNTVVAMVQDDAPQPTPSLSNALTYVIDQMKGTVDSLEDCTVSATVTPVAGNTGNAAFAVGMKDKTGLNLELAYAETITARVTSDAQSGGATAGRESVSLAGYAAATSALSSAWPQGSGGSGSLQLISGSVSALGGTQNWLTNSDFETFTVANIPDNWHIGTGSAGSTVLKSTAQHYTGAASLEFVGNSSESTSVYQELGVDTSPRAAPLDQLACCVWVKTSNTPAAGVLTVELVDGSGTGIVDAQGTDSAFTVDLTTVGTTFAAQTGFLRTPRVLPASVRLRLRLSTALSTGTDVFMDRISLARPAQLYAGGPFIAGFSGATNVIAGDAWKLAISNNRAGLLQTYSERFFNLRTLGLIFPSSTTATIPDSLIA